MSLNQIISRNTLNPWVCRSFSRNFESKASVQPTPTGCPHQVASDEVEWNTARPFKELPGPTKFELIRSFLPGGAYYNKPVTDFMNGLRKKYGDFLIIPGVFGKKAIVMTFDPEVYKKVFRNEGVWPVRRNFESAEYFRTVHRKDYFKGVEGLIMTSGEPWSNFRTAVNPVLMNPKNVRQYLTKMLPVSNEFLQRIREIRDPTTSEVPDTFEDEINRLAFESISVIALDKELGLIRRNRDAPEATTLFESVKEFFELVYVLDFEPSPWKIIKTPNFHKMMDVSETMLQITAKYIDEALERFEKCPHSKDDVYQKSIVEALAEQDKMIAIVMAMDMMLAGVDTTSSTLTGILLGIAKNPDKQEKLRQEIRTILPQKDSMLTIENMANLPYLRASIKEGIRMYPIIPGTVRIMPKHIVISGYQIPEGTHIGMGNNIILREEKYFPKPNEFIPERWLRTEEGSAYKPDKVNPFVYLPFGFGPRSCVGKRIVELELELIVLRLVRNFYIEFNHPIENAFKTVFLTRPAIPLTFKFAEVEDAAATRCPNGAASDEVDCKNARPFKEVPGPSKYELVRSFLPGGAYYNKPVTYFMTDLRRKYGDFAIIPGVFGGKSIVMAFDPEANKKIFRNEGTWPTRRIFDSAHYFRAPFNIFNRSGESWGHFRTAVSPVLMNPKNSKQYLAKMLPVTDEFLQRIREIPDPTTLEVPDTFIDEIDILTFESIAVIALDQQFGLIRRNRDAPEAKTLFEAIKEFFELVYVLDVQPSMWKIIKTKKFHKIMNVSETILEITCQHIDAALERFQKNPLSKDYGYQRSIIETLAEQDKTIAVVTAMDLMLAGVDTTSTTLTGILLGIAKNPDKQEKLRQEIRTILPQKDSMLTIENMANLPYLRACIKEGIRMYPIGPGSVRIMRKDIVISGYQIPEGTLMAMGNNMILRDDKYYPRPNEFIPERWLRTEERNAYKPDVVNPFVYLPFGFGPRSCVGKRIVQVELVLTVSRLVRNFYIEFNYSVENAFKTVFMSRPAIPLKFKFAEVEN